MATLTSRLREHPLINERVGDRIFEEEADARAARPFIVLREISRTPIEHLTDDPLVDRVRVQVDLVADEADLLAPRLGWAIREQLGGWVQSGDGVKSQFLTQRLDLEGSQGARPRRRILSHDYSVGYNAGVELETAS